MALDVCEIHVWHGGRLSVQWAVNCRGPLVAFTGVHRRDTLPSVILGGASAKILGGEDRIIGCLICVGYSQQKSPMFSG